MVIADLWHGDRRTCGVFLVAGKTSLIFGGLGAETWGRGWELDRLQGEKTAGANARTHLRGALGAERLEMLLS